MRYQFRHPAPILRLMVHPIVLGTGKRLFRDDTTLTRLELIESNASSKGVLLLRYRPTDG
jgi:dihydrofolate reductase